MTVLERDWQAQVIQLADLYGWRHYHTFDSRRSAAGFPDLVLIRPPELIFVELKGPTTRITPAQREWLTDLGGISDAIASLVTEAYGAARAEGFGEPLPTQPSIHAFVWRPRDLEVVELTLRRRR